MHDKSSALNSRTKVQQKSTGLLPCIRPFPTLRTEEVGLRSCVGTVGNVPLSCQLSKLSATVRARDPANSKARSTI